MELGPPDRHDDRGPGRRRPVVQLVSAQGALSGWMGLTTRTPDGRLEASILRTQTPDALQTHVLTGDLLAWGPKARPSSRRSRRADAGCYASLVVHRERLDSCPYERVFRRSRFCGSIPTIGQTLATTYFTCRIRGRHVGSTSWASDRTRPGPWRITILSVVPDRRPAGRPAVGQGTAHSSGGGTEPDPYPRRRVSPVVVNQVARVDDGADGAPS